MDRSVDSRKTIKLKLLEKWSTELTLRFLTEYSKHPCLWDINHVSYKDLKCRKTAYKSIVDAMNLENFNEDSVRRKASVLKSAYFNERRKIENGLASGNLYKTKLVWYDLADSFLAACLQKSDENDDADFDPIKPLKLCKNDSRAERKQKLENFSELVAKQLRHMPLNDALKVQMQILDVVLKRRMLVIQRSTEKTIANHES